MYQEENSNEIFIYIDIGDLTFFIGSQDGVHDSNMPCFLSRIIINQHYLK